MPDIEYKDSGEITPEVIKRLIDQSRAWSEHYWNRYYGFECYPKLKRKYLICA